MSVALGLSPLRRREKFKSLQQKRNEKKKKGKIKRNKERRG